jgi:hypothetical protein
MFINNIKIKVNQISFNDLNTAESLILETKTNVKTNKRIKDWKIKVEINVP